MRSVILGAAVPDRDQTTRARVRDTAIRIFGEHGFATGVRAIAAAAGVSPGLVNHHFGSKAGLRAECDKHVLELIRTHELHDPADSGPGRAITALGNLEQYGGMIAYIMRSFQSGGRFAESLFERMVDDTEKYLESGVAAGRILPSRNPRARAHYLTLNSVGSMLLHVQMRAHRGEPLDYGRVVNSLAEEITLPALELYAEGILTDSSILDAFLSSRDGPDTADTAAYQHFSSPTQEQS